MPAAARVVRIATRASALALWQAHHVRDLLQAAHPGLPVELVHVTTTGDRDQQETLRALGSFGVFTREVQLALLEERADLAVHSLKDLPTVSHPELVLAASPTRADDGDALVLPRQPASANGPSRQPALHGAPLSALPLGARVGTGSPRRQAQLRLARPDLQLLEIRGNVDTRLKKLDAGDYDAIVLACAGLTRLGWSERISLPLAPPLMYPAVGQGAIGLETRRADTVLRGLVDALNDRETSLCTLAERSLMRTLQAGCHAPVGVSTAWRGNTLALEAVVLPADGSRRWTAAASTRLEPASSPTGPVSSASHALAEELGAAVAQLLVAQGAHRVL